MSRAWRIEYPKALYHVLSRGNDRRAIFAADDDRRMFLNTIGEMAERFEIDIAAYVLMNNHYHLLLRTRRANLSKPIFSQFVNVEDPHRAYRKAARNMPGKSICFGKSCVMVLSWAANSS